MPGRAQAGAVVAEHSLQRTLALDQTVARAHVQQRVLKGMAKRGAWGRRGRGEGGEKRVGDGECDSWEGEN